MLHFLHSTGTLTVRAGCLAITVDCVFGTDRAPKSGCDYGGAARDWLTPLGYAFKRGTFRYGMPLSNFPSLLQFRRSHWALALSLAATHAISVDFFSFEY